VHVRTARRVACTEAAGSGANHKFTLLRCALTHSGLVPTAAIAATSCAVVQRNIAVQYLTS